LGCRQRCGREDRLGVVHVKAKVSDVSLGLADVDADMLGVVIKEEPAYHGHQGVKDT